MLVYQRVHPIEIYHANTGKRPMTGWTWKVDVSFASLVWEVRNWNAPNFDTQEVVQKLIDITITSQLWLNLDPNENV